MTSYQDAYRDGVTAAVKRVQWIIDHSGYGYVSWRDVIDAMRDVHRKAPKEPADALRD